MKDNNGVDQTVVAVKDLRAPNTRDAWVPEHTPVSPEAKKRLRYHARNDETGILSGRVASGLNGTPVTQLAFRQGLLGKPSMSSKDRQKNNFRETRDCRRRL
jgi:hypothetical protein